MDIATEIAFRQDRRVNLNQAKAVLEAPAEARYQAELADYEAKLLERAEKAQPTSRKLGGRSPPPPPLALATRSNTISPIPTRPS